MTDVNLESLEGRGASVKKDEDTIESDTYISKVLHFQKCVI